MNGKNNTGNYISSGNAIVNKLGQMDFTGNIEMIILSQK